MASLALPSGPVTRFGVLSYLAKTQLMPSASVFCSPVRS